MAHLGPAMAPSPAARKSLTPMKMRAEIVAREAQQSRSNLRRKQKSGAPLTLFAEKETVAVKVEIERSRLSVATPLGERQTRSQSSLALPSAQQRRGSAVKKPSPKMGGLRARTPGGLELNPSAINAQASVTFAPESTQHPGVTNNSIHAPQYISAEADLEQQKRAFRTSSFVTATSETPDLAAMAKRKRGEQHAQVLNFPGALYSAQDIDTSAEEQATQQQSKVKAHSESPMASSFRQQMLPPTGRALETPQSISRVFTPKKSAHEQQQSQYDLLSAGPHRTITEVREQVAKVRDMKRFMEAQRRGETHLVHIEAEERGTMSGSEKMLRKREYGRMVGKYRGEMLEVERAIDRRRRAKKQSDGEPIVLQGTMEWAVKQEDQQLLSGGPKGESSSERSRKGGGPDIEAVLGKRRSSSDGGAEVYDAEAAALAEATRIEQQNALVAADKLRGLWKKPIKHKEVGSHIREKQLPVLDFSYKKLGDPATLQKSIPRGGKRYVSAVEREHMARRRQQFLETLQREAEMKKNENLTAFGSGVNSAANIVVVKQGDTTYAYDESAMQISSLGGRRLADIIKADEDEYISKLYETGERVQQWEATHMKINNNLLTRFSQGLVNSIARMLSRHLVVLDLSFNRLKTIDENAFSGKIASHEGLQTALGADIFTHSNTAQTVEDRKERQERVQMLMNSRKKALNVDENPASLTFMSLTTLYLHGNRFEDAKEIFKLSPLRRQLQVLTFHGSRPLDEWMVRDGNRAKILNCFTGLLKLNFTTLSPDDAS